MATLDISPEQVKVASDKMIAHNQKINADMNALISQLEALSAGWIGAAKNAFDNAKSNWHQTSMKHNKNLAAISAALQQTSKKTTETDQQHVDDFNKFASTLNPA